MDKLSLKMGSPWLEPKRRTGWADRRRENDEKRQAAEAAFLLNLAGNIGLTNEDVEGLRANDAHFWGILRVAARGYPHTVLNYYAAETIYFEELSRTKASQEQPKVDWREAARKVLWTR